MASFRVTLWLFVLVAAALTGLLGWVATRRALAPLRAIKQGAAGITASQLNHRLSLEAVPVELAELAETLNDMLARLEESFRRLSDFSSDLAHELRTPISNLMTQTQVSLSRARSVDEYQDILSSNAEELERMARMVSDMLFLAKADNGLITTSTETVVLNDEVKSLFDFYEALADASSVALVTHGQATVTADRLMLRRALSNLLSNAIRHADPHTAVSITLETHENTVTIMLENTGPGIAPEHLPRLFDRFYRVDASRQRSSEGAGLGLAITQSIVHAHAGTISATSEGGITRFTLVLPFDAWDD
jgi:two-component system heavy metal sensor histidine kinase CusS